MRSFYALALLLAACGDNHESTNLTLQDVTVTTAEDTSVVVDVPLTPNNPNSVDFQVQTQPAHGTVTGSGPTWTYLPEENYSGPDSFVVLAEQGSKSAMATVTITVTPVNDDPVAVDDTAASAIDEDTSLALSATDLIPNDTDVEGDTLTVSAVAAIAETHGTVTLAGTDITYTPDENFFGTAEFSYTVSDGNGGSGTGTVTVTVNPLQDPPVANDDTKTTDEDTVLTFAASTLTANDVDPDGDTMTVTSVTADANTHGTVALAAGTVTYTPDANFNGAASFTYEIDDGNGGTDTATVNVTVTSVDDPATAVDDAVTVAEATTNNAINVLINDIDPDGGTNMVTAVTQPANGTAAVGAGGANVTYTPGANYCNERPNQPKDSFTYTLNGGSTGTVTVTVTCKCGLGKPTTFIVGSN